MAEGLIRLGDTFKAKGIWHKDKYILIGTNRLGGTFLIAKNKEIYDESSLFYCHAGGDIKLFDRAKALLVEKSIKFENLLSGAANEFVVIKE